jgi:hypothetical protein
MSAEDVRVAVLETKLDNLGADVRELTAETGRTRKRLHDLEGLTAALVNVNKERVRDERDRDRRNLRRLNLIAVLVSVAAVASPLIVAVFNNR